MKSCVLTALFLATAAQAAPPTIEDFQRPPAFSGPVLSPDGKHVAAIINPDGKTTALAIIDTDKPGEATPLKAFGEADVRSIHWIDNDRLAFTVQPRVDGEGYWIAPGLWTIGRDGTGYKQWVDPQSFWGGERGSAPASIRRMSANWSLFQPPALDRPGELILRRVVGDRQSYLSYVELARLELATGRRTPLTDGAPEHSTAWVLDAAGRPVFAGGTNGRGGVNVYWREGDSAWKPWLQSDDPDPDRWPIAVDRSGRVYLLVRENGRHTLHRADNASPEAPTTPLLHSSTHDVNPDLVLDADSGELLGLHFETDVPRTAWYAPAMAAAQVEIDRLLPGAANQIHCLRCLAVQKLLVTSVSDRRPPRYFLFDRQTGKLSALAAAMPWLPEGRPRQVVSTSARDGLRLPIIVTHPALAQQRPAATVLLVHGGPWVRGNYWAWQPEPQFYASRGYLVLEVDFRGSAGYGIRHARAGDKQWGLKMQDDLDDALAWAVKQGLADRSRACIVGASYGGYAALMGLSRGQFACAVAGLAPTDLTKLTSRHWADFAYESLNYTLPRLLGDPQTDALILKANSPINLVDKLQGPLLLIYGREDTRVPLAHGTDLRDALTAAGRPPEWVAYPNEGHGFYKWEHRQDAWRRTEAFLATHLAPAP